MPGDTGSHVAAKMLLHVAGVPGTYQMIFSAGYLRICASGIGSVCVGPPDRQEHGPAGQEQDGLWLGEGGGVERAGVVGVEQLR